MDHAEWSNIVASTQAINRTGMQVLLAWALLNIASGITLWIRRTGASKYFHQMNAIWNFVNASIAVWALMNIGSGTPDGILEAYRSGLSMEKILLMNGALDLAYIALGAFLLERGRRKGSELMRGYGPSIILQGAFLCILDAVLFTLNREENQRLYELLQREELSAFLLLPPIPV